jgi:hypothetical protein
VTGSQDQIVLNRPRRRFGGRLLDLAEDWMSRPECELVWPSLLADPGEPSCAACGWIVPDFGESHRRAWSRASAFLDGAHLQDHFYGGSTDFDNLLALCHLCHQEMPSFSDRNAAIEWVVAHEGRPHWQLWTDERAAMGRLRGRSDLRHEWLRFLEAMFAYNTGGTGGN